MLRFSLLKTLAVVALAIGSILFSMPRALSPDTRKAIENAIPGFVPTWLVP